MGIGKPHSFSFWTKRSNLLIIIILLWPLFFQAQPSPHDQNFLIVYTGRSLGALGAIRSQKEHELITEQANTEGMPFKLVSHACWRAPGVTIFMPTNEPDGDELPTILSALPLAKRYHHVRAIRSNTGLLVQDPRRPSPNMLDMLLANPRSSYEFPDLEEVKVTLHMFFIKKDKPVIVVEEKDADWPNSPSQWDIGEINRIDIQKSGRLYELPINLGQIGPRSTLLKEVLSHTGQTSEILLADLGHRDGDFGVSREERAWIDYTAISSLGYSVVVPYQFELAQGASALKDLAREFPGIRFLASNITLKDTSIFEKHLIIEAAGIKIGLIALVDQTLLLNLPRQILEDYVFESPLEAAKREVTALMHAGTDAIIALSNQKPADNAMLAEKVEGIDAILADFHSRWTPENLITEVSLPNRSNSRPGPPSLVARSFDNGLGLGKLDMIFKPDSATGQLFLNKMKHSLVSVTDRIPADTTLTNEIKSGINLVERPRGDLMFPAFIDLVERNPKLQEVDETTRQGRISQEMWEEFVARLMRRSGPAEIAIIRKFPNFPPLIGKLHEKEVRNWLWSEDEVILFDMKGSDIRKLVENDPEGELVVSGIDITRGKNPATGASYEFWFVMDRFMNDEAYYRVASTDVVFEGVRGELFQLAARRVRRNLQISDDGLLISSKEDQSVSLRDFVLNELKRIRSLGKGEAHLDRIAQLLNPNPPYQKLISFDFDRPTVWASVNRKYRSEGFESVPESRVTSPNSWVVGVNGRFKATYDGPKTAMDVGLLLAYARQSTSSSDAKNQVTETMDDIKFDLTFRKQGARNKFHPFFRSQFDTEFTSTVNPVTQQKNSRQLALRGILGFARPPGPKWRVMEAGAVMERDFGQGPLQFGLHAGIQGRFALDRYRRLFYVFVNDVTYFFPATDDTESDLALKYNMVHEMLIPLVDELSLSVAADLFFFKGKVDSNSNLGMNMLLRVGLTYDRLWKPRFQPLL